MLFVFSGLTFLVFNFPSSTDLGEKALRKLAGQALRNEIDVISVWIYPLPVSPTKAGLFPVVVTYFILACSANF
jgi:hypothetical protein